MDDPYVQRRGLHQDPEELPPSSPREREGDCIAKCVAGDPRDDSNCKRFIYNGYDHARQLPGRKGEDGAGVRQACYRFWIHW